MKDQCVLLIQRCCLFNLLRTVIHNYLVNIVTRTMKQNFKCLASFLLEWSYSSHCYIKKKVIQVITKEINNSELQFYWPLLLLFPLLWQFSFLKLWMPDMTFLMSIYGLSLLVLIVVRHVILAFAKFIHFWRTSMQLEVWITVAALYHLSFYLWSLVWILLLHPSIQTPRT